MDSNWKSEAVQDRDAAIPADDLSSSPRAPDNQRRMLEAPLRVEVDFTSLADSLRAEFEKQVSASLEIGGGPCPLTYTFSPDAYHFLTARAEDMFTPDLLDRLLGKLRSWAQDALGAGHVSTPQMHLYIGDCWRGLLRDDVDARWHYMLSLTPISRKSGRVKLGVDDCPEAPGDVSARMTAVRRVLSCPLKFNQLLVHETRHPYGLERAKTSMNPLEGHVFLNGYFW